MKLVDTYKVTIIDGIETYTFEDGISFTDLGEAVAYAQNHFDIEDDINNILSKEF